MKEDLNNKKSLQTKIPSEQGSRKKIKRIFEGKVVSNKMDKTLVVEIVRIKKHPKYGKSYRVSRRYKVHAKDAAEYKVGNKVKFIECRPISKEKRWRILKQLTEGN